MNVKMFTFILCIFVASSVFLYFHSKSEQNSTIGTSSVIQRKNKPNRVSGDTIMLSGQLVKIISKELPSSPPAITLSGQLVDVYIDSPRITEIGDIVNYGASRFTKENIYITVRPYSESGTQNILKSDLDVHAAIFWNMLDAYRTDSSVKWIGTSWVGFDPYGVTHFSKNQFNSIHKVWLNGAGENLELLWRIFLASFWIDPNGKEFVDIQDDNDGYKAVENKSIDLMIFFQRDHQSEDSQKYTVIEPVQNTTYHPFRTLYTKWDIKNKTLLDTFMKIFEETKQDIIDHPSAFVEFKKKRDGPPKSSKSTPDKRYNAIVLSLKNVDTKPNTAQMKDSFEAYLAMKGWTEKDLNLDGIIYK